MAPDAPAHLTALLRHFRDLRDGTHGGVESRADKEAHFERAVTLLDPVARQALAEIDGTLLADSGTVTGTGLERTPDGPRAAWTLSWPEQRAAGLPPVSLIAHFGSGFHHPHLRGATVQDWPLNVFDAGDAAGQLPVLRAITAADLHNLVFRADYRIIPSMTR